MNYNYNYEPQKSTVTSSLKKFSKSKIIKKYIKIGIIWYWKINMYYTDKC